MRSSNTIMIGGYAAAIVGLIDQFSKSWILDHLKNWPHADIVTSYFNLVLSFNRGVTFGIMNKENPYAPYIFIGVAVVIMALLIRWLWKNESVMVALALGLVIGGAGGNMLDRFRHGAVVDFIDVHYETYHWYAFNLADSAIVCGVFLLMIESLFSKDKQG